MNLLAYFTRRTDGRAIAFDAQAYEADLEARLSDRRAKRPANSKRAVQGHKTRKEKLCL